MIETQYGSGEIVDKSTVRGRTQYKVAGYGFEVWLDADDPAMKFASDPRDREWDAWASGRDRGRDEHGHQDLQDRYYPEDEQSHWEADPGYQEHMFGPYTSESPGYHQAAQFDFEPSDHTWDNSTTLPYSWKPKNPVEMYEHEQTISPDHDLGYSPEERTDSSNSRTGEGAEEEHEYPGPAPHLFASKEAWIPPEHVEHDPDFDDYEDYAHNPHEYNLNGSEDYRPHHRQAWTFHDDEPDHEAKEEERWGEYNHHALDSAHVAANEQHPAVSEFLNWHAQNGLDPEADDALEFYDRNVRRLTPDEYTALVDHTTGSRGGWAPGEGPNKSYTIPEHLQAKPGEPSAQDHINADMERVHHLNMDQFIDPMSGERRASWERPAGLSDKYAQIIDAADHFNDPAQRFRDDPHGAIVRHGGIDVSAGLDEDTRIEMDLQPSKQAAILKSAAWKDVRKKAVRIVREGGVHVEAMDTNAIYANVDGDHGTYECMILTGSAYPDGGFSGGKRAIANWKCSCNWGKWAFKRQMTFVGRLCSHGYATYLTQQSHTAKNDKNHPFRNRPKKKAASSLEDFKKWVKDENGDHVDLSAADSYLATCDEPVSREDAEKILDYARSNNSERPERDYDQDDYNLDPEEAYKTAEVLQHQPGKLTPHLVTVPDEHYHEFEDLGDDRKTTGPDQIMARRHRATGLEGEPNPYNEEENGFIGIHGQPVTTDVADIFGNHWGSKVAKGEAGPSEHHPAFAWHVDGQADMPKQGIVHFSALRYMADEDLLNRLRVLSEEGPADHPQHAEQHNHEVSNVVDELHDRGFDAAPLVAMKKAAMWKVADGFDWDDPIGSTVDAVNGMFGGGNGAPPGLDATHDETGQSLFTGPKIGPAGPNGKSTAEDAISPYGNGGFGGEVNSPGTPAQVGQVSPGGAPGGAAPGGTHAPTHIGEGESNKAGEATGGWGSGTGGDTYTVKPGDTLSGIAQSHGGDLTGLENANKAPMASGTNIGANPNLIHPGDQIKVPGSGGGAASGIGAGESSKATGGGSWWGGSAPKAPSAGGGWGSGTPAANTGISSGWGGGKSSSRRFAEMYFTADDEEAGDTSDDKKKILGPSGGSTPAAPNAPGTPGGQGGPYKDVSSGNPLQPRPTTNAQGQPLVGPGGVDAQPMTGNPGGADIHGANPLGAPAAGTQNVTGPKGIDTSVGANPGAGLKKQEEGAPGVGGLGAGMGSMAQGLISEVPSLLSETLPGIGSAIGNGLSGLTKLLSHDPQKFAKFYFQADGSFETEGGPDWMDYPFAGSGPDRQDWSGTSKDYIEENETGNRDTTWMTDRDGDINTYTTRLPQQKKSRRVQADGGMLGGGDAGYGSTGGIAGGTLSPGASGMGSGQGGFEAPADPGGTPTMGQLTNTAAMSESARKFWADAFHPNETGYFNPHNPTPGGSEEPDQQHGQRPGKGKRGPGGPNASQAAGVEEAESVLPELSGAEAGLMVASTDDHSDIVRQFQASGGGCLAGGGKTGGVSDDGIAEAAQRMLRTAGRNYTPAEQRELEEEFHPRGARNLSDLDLRGTHYVD